MTSPSFDLGEVDAFTAGTVGPPGQRVFFLQARGAGQVVTLKCEKQQVEALGQFLERLLQDLPAPGEAPLPTVLELIEPIEPSWIAGQLGVAWEADLDRFVIAVEELDTTALEQADDEDEDDEDDDEDDEEDLDDFDDELVDLDDEYDETDESDRPARPGRYEE